MRIPCGAGLLNCLKLKFQPIDVDHGPIKVFGNTCADSTVTDECTGVNAIIKAMATGNSTGFIRKGYSTFSRVICPNALAISSRMTGKRHACF